MSNAGEIHDFDLDGEDLFPEFIKHGAEILRAGEVTYLAFDGYDVEEVTERHITDPQEAAYFTLLSRGLRPSDTVTIDPKLKTALGSAISRQVPNWRSLRPMARVEEPSNVFTVYNMNNPDVRYEVRRAA